MIHSGMNKENKDVALFTSGQLHAMDFVDDPNQITPVGPCYIASHDNTSQ
jgi:hypothetical protein